jgi:cbb3-type cytochrome oxidase subunit 3
MPTDEENAAAAKKKKMMMIGGSVAAVIIILIVVIAIVVWQLDEKKKAEELAAAEAARIAAIPRTLVDPSKYYGIAQPGWINNNIAPYKLDCNANANDYITGVRGFKDPSSYLGKLGVICKSGINPTFAGTGGVGSPEVSFDCPDGIPGFQGSAAWVVDGIKPYCGTQLGDMMGSNVVPGNGNLFDFKCPEGTKLRSIRGQAGNLVGSMGFVCQ